MPPYLPGEITDNVIAHVWPDNPSLCSCALVHRQWLPTSRYYLFLAIQIDNIKTYTLFLQRILSSEDMRFWLRQTREFRILNAEDADVMAGSPTSFGKRILYEFAGHLPRLQSLELFHVDFVAGGFHPAAYLAFSGFSLIESLSFTNCLFPSFTSFRRLLAQLPSLRDLSLSNVHWHPVLAHHHDLLAGTPQRPLLDSLIISDLEGECAWVFFRWLVHTTSSQTIRRLSFEASMTSTDPESFRLIGSSLTDVHIWLYDPKDVAGIREVLPHFSQVRSLRITVPEMSEESMWPQLAEILANTSSPAIRRVVIEGLVDGILEAELEAGDVKGLLSVPTRGVELLDDVLKRAVFEHLTTLDLHLQQWVALPLDPHAMQDVVLEAIRSKLPKANARGVINLDLQFTRATFRGLPLTKEGQDEGAGMQGWMVVDT